MGLLYVDHTYTRAMNILSLYTTPPPQHAPVGGGTGSSHPPVQRPPKERNAECHLFNPNYLQRNRYKCWPYATRTKWAKQSTVCLYPQSPHAHAL